MLRAKDIIEMEESLIHNPEPRKRSATIHNDNDSMTSQIEKSASEWNPALASRRASVPMEIIIGENGKPIFTATHSNVGSPNISERRNSEKPKKSTEPRSTSKKRSSSVKKKVETVKTVKRTKEKERKEDEKSESPDSLNSLSNDMATCSIGSPSNGKSKNIEHLPEYAVVRTQLAVTVRDCITQTDFF